ncbi:hypothetical protein A2533_04850 [Candidatus Falkowbacteria bacterium RIFOXYD2_FULL_35_9]|uniref:Gcp-like domain-containing protein n=1 Tax=Candidatus Falkowbacteria bacterium RIFOXYC2_FULL_36_12 TaxID=1798002 RepID=A0A1F5SZ23_9BACT|nr:MAG: hypothetical protein A2300_04405 [Candidatus Falkowbacteria bacterium RIFOXYB2_FULL_35_7]OGF31703.1 MAG: hypothetical protein A2478_04415 [Candidatus Falkowbacteria bacterium RIFOXYC2_FULL_36_12]OGF33171.1 MAG: hypothetical protein A2223_04880 [Candidatus Falkowbacteria bacterium RIFOXYA2_FULL_35_8]OGF46183.1 MAG: hypothetical protein A2533_04850 [Candidatus Falkowbacteria bacterium RIFOXYD2_FULL_35_9]
MNLLISTESNSCFSIAIGQENITKMKTINQAFKQSELLLKEIKQIISADLSGLEKIFVVIGPGDFSALRIGCATANALAYGLDIPVYGIKLKKIYLGLEEKQKMEKVWSDGLKVSKKTTNNSFKQIAIPEYGKKPNITKSKK